MSARKGRGQGFRMVEIGGNHFDAAGLESLGGGFGGIAREAADAPTGLVEEDIGYGCALVEVMS